MKQLAYVRDFLIVLFVIYYAQGTLYPTGSILSQGALALILCISVFFLGKTLILKNNKNTFYKAWTTLLLLNVMGFIFTGEPSNQYHFSMFKGILMTALPFYTFYHLAQKGVLKSKHLIRLFILLLPVTILQYFLNASQILDARISDRTDVVNNIAYSFVALIPFVFLFKRKKIIAMGAMLVLIFFIIQGAKRGAIIAGAIGLLGFIYFQLRTVPKKNRFKGYLLVLIVVSGMSYYAYDVFENNDFLISRMQRIVQEGGSSGREQIYTNVFNSWYNSSNYGNLLFGFGFAASLMLSGTGNFSHNDWLELLSNFGMFGVCVYAILFYSATKYVGNASWVIDKRLLLLTILSIWFFTTLVSMSYTSSNGYVQAILLAYLIGSKSNQLE